MFRDFGIECIAMLAIYLVVILDFLRRGHKKFVLYILPLIILPLFHLIGLGIGEFIIDNLLHFNPYRFMICIVLVGIALSTGLITLASRQMKKKKSALYYSIVCFAYTCFIGIFLVMNMIGNFLHSNLSA